jgi:hypothetical protein
MGSCKAGTVSGAMAPDMSILGYDRDRRCFGQIVVTTVKALLTIVWLNLTARDVLGYHRHGRI